MTRFFGPVACSVLFVLVPGCGTTRSTDTPRTATEQLVIAKAVDDAVGGIDFRPLAGRTVFLDTSYLDTNIDHKYLASTLRQHLLACGAFLQEDKTKAVYVVEARAGAVGTDRHSMLIGIPQMNLPVMVPGMPSMIPELPLVKTTDQKGVAKVAVFAYNRQTGRPLMQSGLIQTASNSHDSWFFGMGPYQRGTIRSETEFAGTPIHLPFLDDCPITQPMPTSVAGVGQAASWSEPPMPPPPVTHAAAPAAPPTTGSVQQASGSTPATPAPPPPGPPAPPPGPPGPPR